MKHKTFINIYYNMLHSMFERFLCPGLNLCKSQTTIKKMINCKYLCVKLKSMIYGKFIRGGLKPLAPIFILYESHEIISGFATTAMQLFFSTNFFTWLEFTVKLISLAYIQNSHQIICIDILLHCKKFASANLSVFKQIIICTYLWF